MNAKPGDWLIAQGRVVGGGVRRGLIEEVHGAGGTPPFLVHWTDTGHRALVFPGPDSAVLTTEELRAQDDVAAAPFSSMQRAPSSHAE